MTATDTKGKSNVQPDYANLNVALWSDTHKPIKEQSVTSDDRLRGNKESNLIMDVNSREHKKGEKDGSIVVNTKDNDSRMVCNKQQVRMCEVASDGNLDESVNYSEKEVQRLAPMGINNEGSDQTSQGIKSCLSEKMLLNYKKLIEDENMESQSKMLLEFLMEMQSSMVQANNQLRIDLLIRSSPIRKRRTTTYRLVKVNIRN